MPLPKHKTSKSRRDKRRTHQKTEGPNVSPCPHCGEGKMSHQVCPSCGKYKGKTIIEIKD